MPRGASAKLEDKAVRIINEAGMRRTGISEVEYSPAWLATGAVPPPDKRGGGPWHVQGPPRCAPAEPIFGPAVCYCAVIVTVPNVVGAALPD